MNIKEVLLSSFEPMLSGFYADLISAGSFMVQMILIVTAASLVIYFVDLASDGAIRGAFRGEIGRMREAEKSKRDKAKSLLDEAAYERYAERRAQSEAFRARYNKEHH